MENDRISAFEDGPPATPDWDPLASNGETDPAALYARLRTECPVAYSERYGGFWSLTRYDDIARAALDTETFSSATLATIPPLGGPRRIPLESDPPEHTSIRRILQPYFNPAAVQVLEPGIRRHVTELLAPLLQVGGGDAVSALTHPLPIRVLCELLHVPLAAFPEIERWSRAVVGAAVREDQNALREANEGFAACVRGIVAERRSEPLDPAVDVISALFAATIEGRPLSEAEIVGITRLILSAGHSTTTDGLGNALLRLARDADLQDRLRATPDPGLVRSAVEEFLRLDAPIQSRGRTVTREVEIAGRHLRAGDRVSLVVGSANRDSAAFADPDSCEVQRRPNRHMAFGYGIHRCIGEHLARIEMRIALEEVLARTRSFRLNGPAARRPWPQLGVSRLPLAIDPR